MKAIYSVIVNGHHNPGTPYYATLKRAKQAAMSISSQNPDNCVEVLRMDVTYDNTIIDEGDGISVASYGGQKLSAR